MIRLCLVPRTPGWSYDSTAQALKRHLDDRFRVAITYDDAAAIATGADLYVDFWWAGRLHRSLGSRVVKQVSSHRWRRCGLNATAMTRLHLLGSGGVMVPSLRLRRILDDSPARRLTLALGPKGFEPRQFYDQRLRGGALTVGWAGRASAPDKHVEIVLGAESNARIADACLTLSEMPDFYNAVDVIAVASEAEGDPRPLIEAMACGCFPVTTDVGIAPELVRHGENGLIVERSVAAFTDAFAWCRANTRKVRDAGRANAAELAATRTWAGVVPLWADALASARARAVA